jgi:uncharacterized protein YndB with AHSA1/START domain
VIDQPAPTLEIVRRFDAPPERVFDAWLGNSWGEWLPPAGATCEVATIEPRVGGSYLIRMAMADGRNIEISGAYREIARPERLVLTWCGSYNPHEMLLTLTFRRDGAGTVMTLRQEGFPDEALRDGYNSGWAGQGGSFDKLDRFLAQRPA